MYVNCRNIAPSFDGDLKRWNNLTDCAVQLVDKNCEGYHTVVKLLYTHLHGRHSRGTDRKRNCNREELIVVREKKIRSDNEVDYVGTMDRYGNAPTNKRKNN